MGISCRPAWSCLSYAAGGSALRQDKRRRFELLALPHLDAAYNLARWLTGNGADAEDIVQEAYLRAFRYFEAYRGGDMRVWLLAIVRNTFMTWARENRSGRLVFAPDAPVQEDADNALWTSAPADPETLLLARIDAATLNGLMGRLPADYREVLVLREMEEMPYRDIATVTGVPIGTVMSRLSRARLALRRLWHATAGEGAHGV